MGNTVCPAGSNWLGCRASFCPATNFKLLTWFCHGPPLIGEGHGKIQKKKNGGEECALVENMVGRSVVSRSITRCRQERLTCFAPSTLNLQTILRHQGRRIYSWLCCVSSLLWLVLQNTTLAQSTVDYWTNLGIFLALSKCFLEGIILFSASWQGRHRHAILDLWSPWIFRRDRSD